MNRFLFLLSVTSQVISHAVGLIFLAQRGKKLSVVEKTSVDDLQSFYVRKFSVINHLPVYEE